MADDRHLGKDGLCDGWDFLYYWKFCCIVHFFSVIQAYALHYRARRFLMYFSSDVPLTGSITNTTCICWYTMFCCYPVMFYCCSSVVDNGPTFLVCWECCGQDTIIIGEGQFYSAVQNQEAVTCYFSRKWLLPFGFTDSIADCHWFVGPGRRWTDEGIVLWNLTNFPRVTEFLPS